MALLGTVALADYPDEVRQDLPIGYWRFVDESADEGMLAKDEIGRHPGVYHGGITLDVDAPATGGKAARFDGKSAYVEIPSHADFALDEMSVELWLKSTQSWVAPFWPASATLISNATAGDGSGDWALLGGSTRDGDRQGCVIVGVGPKTAHDVLVESPGALNDGAWHHLVWTRSSRGLNRLYVDGGLANEAADGGGSIVNDRPIQCGGDPWLKGRSLMGSLAEVAIYRTVLSADRVRAHAEAAGLKPRQWQFATSNSAAPATTTGPQTTAGWLKSKGNPFLGGALGTCFDISVLKDDGKYRMWLSWRPKASVALVESLDGLHWTPPEIVVAPRAESGWEDDINRPVVLKRGKTYHMWYTGFNAKGSALGYATSHDGRNWQRMSEKPVLISDQPWEEACVMCPHVLWDDAEQLYKMWYSAGERNEPNAIGYATSRDGLSWKKHSGNPIFVPDPQSIWERHKVTACQVIQQPDGYVMFYIGFRDESTAQIGLARSKDGVTNWCRHGANPIVRPGKNQWDHDACYKPYAIFDGGHWMLWYNGRRGGLEQIGLVTHEGEDLGFDVKPTKDEASVGK
jgi:predicted GH43/DUF377 family glycosyl hydrolase